MDYRRMNEETRKIIHIDMDCFYAAVEAKHNPDLKGKPIAVGGPANSRSVLTTASYEARKYGVRSAMPSSRAVRLCPQLIIVKPNFDRYKAESQAVRKIFSEFTDQIEPLSLDEAYLDVSQCAQHSGSATLIAKEIRSLIQKETGLTASAGIAPNKFLAKIASDWNKPNGQFVIRPSDIKAFMPTLKIEKIYGVGKVTAQKMHEKGLFTCGDIQKTPPHQLTQWFGSRGLELLDMAFGIDHRKVEPHQERKSLTVEETFETDLKKLDECLSRIPALYEDWEKSMIKANVKDRLAGIVVKLKFHDFKTTTHETSSKIWPTAKDFETLLTTAWQRRREPVRLIGIGARLTSQTTAKDTDQLKFELS
jgi:DNA polymerase IV